jgi:hypothetical protein
MNDDYGTYRTFSSYYFDEAFRKTIKDTLTERGRYGAWHTVFGGTYLYCDNVYKPARKPH